MSNTPTIPTEPTTTPPAEPADDGTWRDGTTFEPARAMNLITTLRGHEKQNLGRISALEGAVKALVSGQPLSADHQATIDAARAPAADLTAKAYEDGLLAVGAILGVSAADIKAGPDALLNAARQARLAGPLAQACQSAQADPSTTLAILNHEGALRDFDMGDGFGHRIGDLVAAAVKAHPNLLVRQYPGSAGSPMPAGSGGNLHRPELTRDVLAMMAPRRRGSR